MYSLEGRTAIVTGAGTGIGRAVALRLADEGCAIGIFELDPEAADRTAAEVEARGRRVHIAVGNVAFQDDVDRGMASLLDGLGGSADILVNNAGILRIGKLVEMAEKDWTDSFQVNVDGVFRTTRAVLPHMIRNRSGCVVNMASWLGKKAVAHYSAYCASKFAVVGITQALALEVAEYGIRVNAVAPGIIVDTGMRQKSEALHEQHGLPKAQDRTNTIPLKRLGYPDDVANVVAFLASDQAGYMTGQAINITGGLWTH